MSRPNILLLFTDQQRFDSLGAVNPVMKTPAMDRLIAEGCLFENAYTPNPVCMPARHNLLTGLTARYHGYATNSMGPIKQSLPCLPELLANSGYHTEAIGKMHFCPMREHHGFQRMQLMEETPHYRQDDDYLLYLKSVGLGNIQHQHGVRHLLYHQPQRALVGEEHHGSKWVADRSIEFLAEQGDRPFFLWSSWIAPHPPYNIPDEWADVYKNAAIAAPTGSPNELPPIIQDYTGFGDMDNDPDRMRRHREAYYAAVAFVDHQMGRVLDQLDALGMADNTLVILTTDHGEMAGDLGIFQKSSPYEGACHIPMVIRYPKVIPASQRRTEFADLNDILPTCLDAAGVQYTGENELPGESLLIDNSDSKTTGCKDRSVQYIENGWIDYKRGASRWRMIRDDRYKYVQFHCGGYEMLMDMQEDPQELCNLMLGELNADQESARQRLRSRLLEYEERWGLEGGVVDGELSTIERFDTAGPRRCRCSATPSWPPNLTRSDEIEAMNSIEDEMLAVLKDEPLVKLSRLDLDAWSEKTGFADMAERFRQSQ